MTVSKPWLLGGILLLGFVLRAAGVQFGLPHLYHADEPIVVNHALAFGSGDLNPHFFKIPPLVSYLLFVCYGIFFVFGKLSGHFQSAADFENFFYADPSAFYLIARTVFGVLMGTAAIYALYRVLEKNFSQRLALASAFFLSVCFLHVRDSHYIYADIPLSVVIIAAFGVFFRVQSKPSIKWHLVSGCMIGLAAAVKYNGAALIIPYLAACFLSSKKLDFKGWLAAGLASAAVFAALNPYAVLDSAFFISELRSQAASQGGTPWEHHLKYSLTEGMGLPMLAAGILGLIMAGVTKKPRPVILASFALAYYEVLVRAGQPYDRYALPLVPVLCFFAAQFLIEFCERKKYHVRTLVLILLFIAAFPLTKSIAFDRLMMAQDVRAQSKRWVEQNIPAGSKIALDWEFYAPRLSFSKEQLLEKKKQVMLEPKVFSNSQVRKLDYLLSSKDQVGGYDLFFLVSEENNPRFLFGQPVMPYSIGRLKQAGIQYVIILPSFEKGVRKPFFEELRKTGEMIQSFSPYRDSGRRQTYDDQPLTGGPFLWDEVRERERNGLPIEIYKLEP